MTAMNDSEQRMWCTKYFSFRPLPNICIVCKFSDFPLEFSVGILQVKLYLNYRNHMNEIKVHQPCSTCGEVKNANKTVLGVGIRENKS
jgi:hypothetical protein